MAEEIMTIDEAITEFEEATYGKDVRKALIDVAKNVKNAVENQLITVDDTLTESGQGADAAAVGLKLREINKVSVAEDEQHTTITVDSDGSTEYYVVPNDGIIGRMSALETNNKVTIVGAINELKNDLANASIKDSVKQALLGLADAVGYKNDAIGATARSALYHALYDTELLSITAVFTQGTNIIYDSLNVLKQYLTVTANYDDGTSGTVTSYTLSGTLTVGTSTITVTYSGKTTTFNVTVSAGVPDTYAKYEYIWKPADSNNDPAASWITLATYANLDALSFKVKVAPVSGYVKGGILFGARNESGVATGTACYVGSPSNSAVGESDKVRAIAHGEYQQYTTNSMNIGQPNIFEFVNSASSPSEMILNGVSTPLTWSTQLTVNKGFTLFTNPTPGATQMNLRGLLQLGNLILKDLSGNVVGDYVAVRRISDSRLGMFDRVSQTFFTSSTASYTTEGNSACKYAVGNWS